MPTSLNFGDWDEAKSQELFGKLRSWEAQVYSEYKSYVKDPDFDSVTKKSINIQGVLGALRPADRKRLLHEYRRIIGFDEMVAQGAMTEIAEERNGKSAVHKFNVRKGDLSGSKANPLAIMYNRFFVNGSGADDPFRTGSNILKADFLEQITNDLKSPSPIGHGKKVMVLDTETTGLPYNSARGTNVFPDIRQVSAAMMATDDTGKLGKPALSIDEHFMTARMQIGMLHNPGVGQSQRLDKWIENVMVNPIEKTLRNKIPGGGPGFVKGLTPFLQQMVDADVIAGHNIAFDLDQILGGLSRTSAYHHDKAFAELLNKARDSISHPGKVKDTMEMARALLPDIETAAELSFGGERLTRHSVENLMLQTNLTQLLKNEMGPAEFAKMFDQSLHAGQVDTMIEAHLLRFLTQMQEGETDPSKVLRVLDKGETLTTKMRHDILKSYAPTPISNINDISHIDPEIFRRMVEETQTEGMRDSIRLRDAIIGDSMPIGKRSVAQVRYMIDQNAGFAAMKITPIEQEMLLTRKLSMPVDDVTDDQLLFGQGNWRRFAGQDEPYEGFLNEFGTLFRRGIRPEDDEFDLMRRAMARSGIPFAGLSLPEQWLTSSIAQASMLDGGGGRHLGGTDKMAAQIGDDLGIGRFELRKTAYFKDGGKNISLPMEVIREAENQKILKTTFGNPLGENVQMMNMSAYTTRSGVKEVGLGFDVSESEAKALGDWLGGLDDDAMIGGKSLRDLGLQTDRRMSIAANIGELAPKHGINVGVMSGAAGEKLHNVFESFYQGQMRDIDKIPMRAGFMGVQDNIIMTGATILDRLHGKGEMGAYRASMNQAMTMHQRLAGAMTNKYKASAAKIAYKTGMGEAVQSGVAAYESFRGKGKVVGIGLGIAALTGYMLHRHNKLENGNEAMAQMPYEDSSAREQYYQELGMNPPPERLYDPLATAGLVAGLDQNRTGHHQMGSNKNSNLFSGVM